jgi:hypothetical protein
MAEVRWVFGGNVSFSDDRLRSGGGWDAWVCRLRWAHLLPEALAFSLWYRLGRRKSALVLAAVEPGPRSFSRYGRPPLPTAATAVRLATLIPPFRTTCLVRSMVLARMLRRRGYPAEVVIGITEKGVDRDPRFAHAWVAVKPGPGSPGFSELVRLVP